MTRALCSIAVIVTALAGCAPEIGDECDTSVDCSVNGDRICDRTQPGGYCTVQNCEENTCPEGGVCVEYRYEPERLSRSFCMAPCEDSGDCRGGYECIRASQIVDGDPPEPLARILDDGMDDSMRFCSASGF